jgi:hypothetical protein
MDKAFGWVVAIGVGLVFAVGLLSFFGMNVPAFNPALESWTKWLAGLVAIIISARVLWTTAEALVTRLNRQ